MRRDRTGSSRPARPAERWSSPRGAALTDDLLATASWECASFAPDGHASPADLPDTADWLPASVPGTAAAALRRAGLWRFGVDDEGLLDGSEWWFRCRFSSRGERGPHELRLGGLATLADVWLNGVHLLHSENMFVSHRVPVSRLEQDNELALRFAALTPVLARRHPRPRWKSLPLRSQSLRWYRTTAQGRLPDFARWAAPVGPWRPVELVAAHGEPAVVERRLEAHCEGDGGLVAVRAVIGGAEIGRAELCVGDDRVPLTVVSEGARAVASGSLALARVERWWPHTHGEQPLYRVQLDLDGTPVPIGSVGFRTLALDRADGAFTLRLNDVPIFCRGASFIGRDPVTFASSADDVRGDLERARGAGMNMLRIPGYGCYAEPSFWDACDELGVLVWQDCMLSTVDPPDDRAFWSGYEAELRQVFGSLGGRPSLAVACGGTEIYQQAAMFGLPFETWRSPLLEEAVPALIADLVPGVPYVPTTPIGGELPFQPDAGACHYFGIGAYMQPLAEARLARVRFASECLAFGIPPEPETVDEVFGGARVAGHDARWKSTVTRDPGMAWDYEDVSNHYVQEIFGLDAASVRYQDPERALDLARAAIAESMSVVLTDWRRGDSPCDGALILGFRDAWPGAGWGLIDALGRPKAPWYAVARAFAARCVTSTDERLSGLRIHVFNDGPAAFTGSVRLTVFDVGGAERERGAEALTLPPHGVAELSAQRLLGGFRDLTNAFRFAPVSSDVVWIELLDADGRVASESFHLPGGPARPVLPEVGLEAQLERTPAGAWAVRTSSRLFAHYVVLDVPGFTPADSWYHLAPGQSRVVALQSTDPDRIPAGSVRALNAASRARLTRPEATA